MIAGNSVICETTLDSERTLIGVPVKALLLEEPLGALLLLSEPPAALVLGAAPAALVLAEPLAVLWLEEPQAARPVEADTRPTRSTARRITPRPFRRSFQPIAPRA
jgi:hypothetical protein